MKKIYYGGDYNPEQWPKEIWEEDMRLLQKAHIDILTLNVFNWALLQPSEEEYNFTMLDSILKMVKKSGMSVCLATSTGAHPAWMAKRYPDILRTEWNGMKRKFGGRHNSCPNSSTYHTYSVRLAGKLAERYQNYENIAAWHISNEYGGECYCENCEKAFRVWLKIKYHTIDEVNRVWNTRFWGHTFYDWEEIVAPNLLSEHFEYERTMFQGISLDYKRFQSESMLACYRAEYEAVKQITPQIPVTTNLMGSYKMLNYKEWGKYMDFISWDNYPSNEDTYAEIAFNHDLMRGVGGGKPFVLMEQTPSVTNWQPYNALKRPGVMRLWSYQAVAHGADAVMFFQMRRSIGACEKLHGAVIDHVGKDTTRVFREVQVVGEELKKLGSETLGGKTEAKVAVYFDWENWWAIEYSAGPSRELKYKQEVLQYYQALLKSNIPLDIIGPEDNLERYQMVVAPLLYMMHPGYETKIKNYVEAGGFFVTTFFSGIVEEHDLVETGGYPGRLRELAGIWVEESDALPADMENHFTFNGKRYPAKILCDLCHLEGAQSLASYEEDFYKGMPALTKANHKKGSFYYVATSSSQEFYYDLIQSISLEAAIIPVMQPEDGVEITERKNINGTYLFLLNHTKQKKKIIAEDGFEELFTGKKICMGDGITLQPNDVQIWKKQEI